jgi:hypothetical protein
MKNIDAGIKLLFEIRDEFGGSLENYRDELGFCLRARSSGKLVERMGARIFVQNGQKYGILSAPRA